MDRFDRSFRRTTTMIKVVWVIVILFILGTIGGSIWLIGSAAQAIDEHGLKGVIERIWEGNGTK